MTKEELQRENEELRRQLAEAEDALAAIREGQVDAIIMDGAAGPQVFSLTGAETAYRLAFETMAEAAISTTADGIILFCNSRFSEFVATPMEQLLGHDIAGFVSPGDRDAFRTLLHQCCDQSIKQRVTLCGPGGVGRPVHLTGTALHQGDGVSLCFVAADLSSLESSAQQIELLQQAQSELRESRRAALNMMEDAQEARREVEQAAAALQQSKATLLSFYDSAPFMMGIAELDGDKTIAISGNRTAAEFFGVQLTDLPGKTGPELGNLAEFERLWIESYRRAQQDGAPVHFEYEYPRPDGLRWLSATVAFIEISSTGKPRFSYVIEDITQRKQVEAVLRESEARRLSAEATKAERDRLYNVLEKLPAYTILLSPDYHVPFANRFFRERFGESHGARCYEYLFQRTEPCEVCETYCVLKTNAPHHWEWLGPDERNYDVYDFPFTDSDGSSLIFEMGIDVTEMKRAQAALKQANETLEQRVEERTAELRESEERYRGIVETAEEGIATHEPDGTITYVNRRMADMLGYPPEEIIGKSSLDFVDDDEKEAVIHARGQMQEQGGVSRERKLYRKDGSTLWTLSNISTRRDEAGNFIGYLAMHTDITVRKQAEERLLAAHAEIVTERNRLQAVMEALPVGVAILDANGGNIRANRAFDDLWGSPRPAPSGINDYAAYKAWWPDSGQLVQPEEWASAQVIRTGEPVVGQILDIERFDGKHSYVVNSAAPIFDDVGQLHGCAVAIMDITAEKKAEDALKESEKRYRELVQYAPAGIYEIDFRARRFMSVNDAMCHMSGYTREELLGMDPLAILAQDSQKLFMQRLQMWLEGNPPEENIEYEVARKDGSKIDVLLNVSFTRDVLGVPLGASVIGYDITERKKAEKSLELINRMLKALSNSNQAMMRAESEADLLNNVCRIIVDDCGYAMVWVGYAENDEQKSVRPVASAGFEAGYLETLEITWADTERGRGPTGMAVRTGKTSRCRNMLTDPQFAPWRDQALERGYASSMVVPLLQNDKSFGAITIYAHEPDAFSDEEEELLNQLAGDLTYGIQTIRLREALRTTYTELEQRVAELQTLMDVAPVAIGIGLDPQGKIVAANRVLSEWLGAPEGANVSLGMPRGQRPIDFQVLRNGQPVKAEDLPVQYAALNARSVRNDELTLAFSDGKTMELLANAEPLFDADGCVRGSIATYIDISERKRAEDQLRAAHDELDERVRARTAELAATNKELRKEISERKEVERQLRLQTTAMEAAANGIVITDAQANIQWANPALFQMSGYTRDEFLGKSMRIFKSGHQDEDYYRRLWDTVLAGNVWQGEMVNRRKDGSTYFEEQTITPVPDERGQITHFISIKQDITARRQAEEELERRNAELQVISSAEREQRQLAEALVKAALVLNNSLNQNEVLQHILEQIREVIPYQFASIALLDGETFYDASHQGTLGPSGNQYDFKQRLRLKDFPALKEMCQTGQPVLMFDTSQDANWAVIGSLVWSRSFLSAPLLVEQQVIGFVNLFSAQPLFFTQAMCDRLVAFAAHAAVAIQNAWLFERVRAGSARLQSLSRRLVEIQESERHYIARELHDEAGQMLASLIVHLRVLEKDANRPELVLKKIAEMEASLNDVFDSLHRIAVALRPATLDHLGLVAALHQYIEALGEKQHLEIRFNSEKVQERLPVNVETVLYRIAQESLTNVMRHAQATQVDVVLTMRDDKVILIIEDDGVGFDPNATSDGSHLGLFGMRERIETVDGKLVIESAPGKGTTVMAEVRI